MALLLSSVEPRAHDEMAGDISFDAGQSTIRGLLMQGGPVCYCPLSKDPGCFSSTRKTVIYSSPQRSLWLPHESDSGKYSLVCTTPSFAVGVPNPSSPNSHFAVFLWSPWRCFKISTVINMPSYGRVVSWPKSMVPPRHGNHTLSFMDHYVTNDSIISSLLLYCHSCQLFMDFPSWAVCRTYLLPCVSDWCFRFLYLALFVTVDEFVNSYLLYPSPAPRCRYLIMTSTFVDLLEMFFHALWQLAEVDFTRIFQDMITRNELTCILLVDRKCRSHPTISSSLQLQSLIFPPTKSLLGGTVGL